MVESDGDVGVTVGEATGKLFGAVDGAVLTAGASEGDEEVGEMAFEVFVNALGDKCFTVVEELEDGGFTLQKFDDRAVFAGVGLVFGVATGVGECAAVEDEAAAIAGGVVGKALFVAEGSYRYCESGKWGVGSG